MRVTVGLPLCFAAFLCFFDLVTSRTEQHDESFIPDAVLHVTQQNLTQSCLASMSSVLINGTAPGPELRLVEDRTYWIRVYNDMAVHNLTMVRLSLSLRSVI